MGGRATIAVGVATAAALSGCYGPHPAAGAPCDLALDNCPSGQHCIATAEGSFCYATDPGMKPDGPGPGDPDGPRPDNAPNCYGTGLVHDLCAITPSNDLAITANRTINTAMVGGTNCDSIIAGGAASLCLVTAQSMSIASGVTVTATGPNPLVLIGTQSIDIAGTLDAASHRGGGDGPGTRSSCGTGNEGALGNGTVTNGGGAGGGAGGSFGTVGGGGGTGNQGSAGGNALGVIAPSSITSLAGGCPGGPGGNGRGMPSGGMPSGSGAGGKGGGAVYLITTGALTISGVINASGAGGGPGTDGWDSGGGGGGGGAGGFIGLDAPTLMVTGAVFANGGSGGGGNGNDVPLHGSPGNDPSSPTSPAVGGAGGQNGGGPGGDGFAGAVSAKKGSNATGQYCAGGGGGGGGGIIKLYGAAPPNGTFSPTPQ